MNQEMEFKNIVAQYSNVTPEEITNNMRFREDLGFSSLDFMSFLGELEDTFDIELEESEVMKIVTGAILELLNGQDQDTSELKAKGTVLLATVAGDVHDIGKSIVASTLKNAGFDVIDLGCEVPVDVILEEAKNRNADIIGTSALLTSTMAEQKKLEKLLAETGEKDNFITMVGGAPCTQRWAKKIGAGGYSEDAIDAVKVALRLIRERKENE